MKLFCCISKQNKPKCSTLYKIENQEGNENSSEASVMTSSREGNLDHRNSIPIISTLIESYFIEQDLLVGDSKIKLLEEDRDN